jgi:putative copper resistance protein D
LIWVRAIHFASTISVAGVVFFLAFVGEPAFRAADKGARTPALVRSLLARVEWIGLAFVLMTGAAWLILQAQQMSERPLAAVFSEGMVWTVLSDTDFGSVWLVRFALIVLLALALYWFGFTEPANQKWSRGITLALAAGLVGTLALVGHAGAGAGIEGNVHLSADILHLVAASAWVGALVPLAVLLGAARRSEDHASLLVAREATLRFSTLGIASVGTLLATGIVNSWVLAGTVPALIGTGYGRLLLVKVALFLVMLSIAAVNRLRLTPDLVQELDVSARQDALRQLRNNSLVEATVGAIILFIVGWLGTLPPALDDAAAALSGQSHARTCYLFPPRLQGG